MPKPFARMESTVNFLCVQLGEQFQQPGEGTAKLSLVIVPKPQPPAC
jgi:hypothetical protein